MTTTIDRRKFLAAGGVTAVAAAAAGVGGELLLDKRFPAQPKAAMASGLQAHQAPELKIEPMTPLPADETLTHPRPVPVLHAERAVLPGRHGPGRAAGLGRRPGSCASTAWWTSR